jgi:hypothetical protein
MKDNSINRTLQPPDPKDNDTEGKLTELLEYVRKNYDPSDLFDLNSLHKWATENGYIKINDKDY